MDQVDRRQFMQKAGIAGATAGALWVAPSVLGSSTAWAEGSCVAAGSLLWTTNSFAGVGGVVTPFTPSRTAAIQFIGTVPAVTGHAAIHVRVTVTPVGTPGGGGPNNGGIHAAVDLPGGGTTTTLDTYTSYYALNMQQATAAVGYTLKFEFLATDNTTKVNVYNLTYKIIDVDRDNTSGNQYQDKVYLTNSVSSAGAASSFGGTYNASFVSGAGTSGNPWLGISTAGVTNDNGTITVNYPRFSSGTTLNPVQTTTVNYVSGNASGGIQYIGLGDLSWCY